MQEGQLGGASSLVHRDRGFQHGGRFAELAAGGIRIREEREGTLIARTQTARLLERDNRRVDVANGLKKELSGPIELDKARFGIVHLRRFGHAQLGELAVRSDAL